MCENGRKVPWHTNRTFLATVTGQVRDNIESFISPLTGIGTDESYNPEYRNGWNVIYEDMASSRKWQIGALSMKENRYVNQACQGVSRVDGLFVSDVYVWGYEDALRTDAVKKTTFASQWPEDARQYGSVLIVNIAGYAGNH